MTFGKAKRTGAPTKTQTALQLKAVLATYPLSVLFRDVAHCSSRLISLTLEYLRLMQGSYGVQLKQTTTRDAFND